MKSVGMLMTVNIFPTSSPVNIIISFATEVMKAVRNVLDSWVTLDSTKSRKYFYFPFWHNNKYQCGRFLLTKNTPAVNLYHISPELGSHRVGQLFVSVF